MNRKNLINYTLSAVFAFYFGFKLHSEQAGIFMFLVQGPYPTKQACEHDFALALADMTLLFGPDGFAATKCTERLAL